MKDYRMFEHGPDSKKHGKIVYTTLADCPETDTATRKTRQRKKRRFIKTGIIRVEQ